jgi:hypothetical protein
MRPVPNGVAFQGRILVIGKPSNKRGESFLSEKVYENKSIIHRGVREDDKLSVFVRLLKPEYPTHEELDLFEYNYEITKELNLHGVIDPN